MRRNSSRQAETKPPEPYRAHRNVQRKQGDFLWLEQTADARGRGRMTMVMGHAWMMEFIFLERGRVAFWQDGRRITPQGRVFGVFYAPFSISEVELSHARIDWVGVAGVAGAPETEPLLFEFSRKERPRNAQQALEVFSRRGNAKNISITARAPRLAERAKLLLGQQFTAQPSVAAVARRLRVSHAHLSRTFRAAYGLAPLEYCHRLRMNDAYYLLSQGQRIVDVSLDVGYNDLSRFYKQFRKLARVPPGSCRETLREKQSV
jgi:AraC-like DNA-binding protein